MPDGWALKRIDEICEPQETKHPVNDNFRYIDIESIDNKRHCVSSPKIMATTLAPSRAAKGVRFGDTLFSMVRPYLENIAFVSNNLSDCIVSTGFYVCRPFENVLLPRYLYFCLTSNYAIDGISSYMRGDNSPAIRKDEMDNFQIPLPPLAEQHRIVTAIESAFAVIDEIERNQADLQAAITAAKSKILDLAIRGKLVPQDPNDEPASVLLERIRAEREQLIKAGKIKRNKSDFTAVKSDDNSYYSELPGSWVLCNLDYIGITNIGLTYKPLEINAGGVPVLRSSNIKNGVLDYTDLVRVATPFNESLELNEGDIIICARNGSKHLVGKCALIPELSERMTFGAFMAVYRSQFNQYIYHFFNSHFFRQIFESEGISTQINQLTQAMIKQIVIPLPPLAEQQRIVTAIEATLGQLDIITATLI